LRNWIVIVVRNVAILPCFRYEYIVFSKDVNFEELARCTDDFNGAQCKAVCVEAGMIALRRDATEVVHEDFMDAVLEVQAKKKASLNYYA
ncbi:hypothetical protein ANCCAN_11230, partial [Ancylostoma caninum]